jgi:putative SOS response-associated peptidase YedK
MCGRTQLLMTWDELAALYRIVPEPEPDGPALPLATLPRWSVAPTQGVPGVRFADGQRILTWMRWGYPMTWLARQGKDPWSRPLINAKAEEAVQKRTWSASLRARRCVVPATAFYEWLRSGKSRFPVELSPAHGPVLHLAAIWQRFEKDGQAVDCVSVLTTEANTDVRPVHHRMPVLLRSDADIAAWIDGRTDLEHVQSLMAPAPDGSLRLRPMHTRLNHWSATGDDLRQADWSPESIGAPEFSG